MAVLYKPENPAILVERLFMNEMTDWWRDHHAIRSASR